MPNWDCPADVKDWVRGEMKNIADDAVEFLGVQEERPIRERVQQTAGKWEFIQSIFAREGIHINVKMTVRPRES